MVHLRRAGAFALVVAVAVLVCERSGAQAQTAAQSGDKSGVNNPACAALEQRVRELEAQVKTLQRELALAKVGGREGGKDGASRASGSVQPPAEGVIAQSVSAFPPMCNPPTYIGSDGVRRVFPECVDSLMADRGPSVITQAHRSNNAEELLRDRGPRMQVPRLDPAEVDPCVSPTYVDAQGVRRVKPNCY